MANKFTNKCVIPYAVIVCLVLLSVGILYFGDVNTVDLSWADTDSCYRITQYGNDKDSQMMFYTIESSDGRFAVIDGGWNWNADAVREVIKKHNNHVDAWILTHPHPDHIGAFNEIMHSPKGIKVDMVYDVYIDLESYEKVAREWDEIDVYKDYLMMAFDACFPVTHLQRNDKLDIIGLQANVLNSFDEEVINRTQSYCNSGSMILKLQANEMSFLFCSDVEEAMADYIIEQYGDNANEMLASDYVQMSHHGNWGLTEKFYDNVHAKIAFFDGPDYLYEDSELYNGHIFMKYMNETAETVYTYGTAPNSVIVH